MYHALNPSSSSIQTIAWVILSKRWGEHTENNKNKPILCHWNLWLNTTTCFSVSNAVLHWKLTVMPPKNKKLIHIPVEPSPVSIALWYSTQLQNKNNTALWLAEGCRILFTQVPKRSLHRSVKNFHFVVSPFSTSLRASVLYGYW